MSKDDEEAVSLLVAAGTPEAFARRMIDGLPPKRLDPIERLGEKTCRRMLPAVEGETVREAVERLRDVNGNDEKVVSRLVAASLPDRAARAAISELPPPALSGLPPQPGLPKRKRRPDRLWPLAIGFPRKNVNYI